MTTPETGLPPMLKLLTCSTMTVPPSVTSDFTSTITPPDTASWAASSDLMASRPRRTPCGPSTHTAPSAKKLPSSSGLGPAQAAKKLPYHRRSEEHTAELQ